MCTKTLRCSQLPCHCQRTTFYPPFHPFDLLPLWFPLQLIPNLFACELVRMPILVFVCGFPLPMNLHLFVDLCIDAHSHFNLKPSSLVLFYSFFIIFHFNVSFMVEHLNPPTNFLRVFFTLMEHHNTQCNFLQWW